MVPQARPSMSRVASPLFPVRRKRTPTTDGPTGTVSVGLDHVVVAEAVVVEDQPAVLDEEADSGVFGSRGVEDTTGTLGPVDDGSHVPTPPPERRGHLAGQWRHGREVGVAPTGRMGRAVAVAGEEQLDGPVVEGQHPVLLGFRPPQLDHLGHLLGHLRSQVVAFGSVLGQVVQLPVIVLEGYAGLVAGHGLPPVGVDGPVAHHLVVLDVLGGGPVGSVEGVAHGDPRDGDLLAGRGSWRAPRCPRVS